VPRSSLAFRLMPNAILLATLEALCQHWHGQSLLPTPDPTADVVAAAKRNGVSLPADFAAFYQRANGMALTGLKDFDAAGFYFPPVEALRSEPQELLVCSGRGPGGVERVTTTLTVFVDFMHTSWDYGFIPAASGTGYEIGIRPNLGEFKVITTSLATFLNLYIEDALVLYDHRNPFVPHVPEP
jgi:hypothetical protein